MPASNSNTPRRIEAHARRLVEQHLRSVAEVELLLLLYRSPETFWSPSAAANVLRADGRDVRAHLTRFAAAGLLQKSKQSDAFRFEPASEESREGVAALAEAWAANREEVLHVLWGSIAQITAFSEAFRFPKS